MKRMKESEVVGHLPCFLIFHQVKLSVKNLVFLPLKKIFQHEKKQITVLSTASTVYRELSVVRGCTFEGALKNRCVSVM